MMEVPQELAEKIYKLIESVKIDGKLRKGANETTKSLEKDECKIVIVAADVTPKEIILHFEPLAKEKNIPCAIVPSRAELGAAAGLPVGTTAVAIVKLGEAKKNFDVIISSMNALKKGGKEEKPVEKKEAKPEEKPKAEKPKKEEVKAEEKPAKTTSKAEIKSPSEEKSE